MSLWNRLPSAVMDLIFSYDNTYHEYMKEKVLQIPLSNKTESNGIRKYPPSIFTKESSFYQSVIKIRYNSAWHEILYILNQKTAHKLDVVFPQPHEIQTRIYYTMKTKIMVLDEPQILRKWVFEYNRKTHWYIVLEKDFPLQKFMTKFLSKRHIDFLSFSEILLFDNICSNYRYLVSAKRGDQYRRYPRWIREHEYQSVVMTGFDIVIHNIILEMDVVNIFILNGKLYINIRFDDDGPFHYQRNKEIYHCFIYYVLHLSRG